jgi:hypothetical protein
MRKVQTQRIHSCLCVASGEIRGKSRGEVGVEEEGREGVEGEADTASIFRPFCVRVCVLPISGASHFFSSSSSLSSFLASFASLAFSFSRIAARTSE